MTGSHVDHRLTEARDALDGAFTRALFAGRLDDIPGGVKMPESDRVELVDLLERARKVLEGTER